MTQLQDPLFNITVIITIKIIIIIKILQIQDGGGSHGLVNSAMGQIPCSTERISCY